MNTAIVLAGGSGKRMHSEIPKQYMQLNGKPVIYYSLKALNMWMRLFLLQQRNI